MTPEEALALYQYRKQKQANAPSSLVDASKAGSSGFLESLASTPDMMPGTNLVQMGAKALGLPDELYSPSALIEKLAPGAQSYEPQTELGKFARPVGQAAGALALGPGGVAGKTAMAIGAGVTSEAGGRLAQEYAPSWEPAARAGGMILGGIGTSGAGMKNRLPVPGPLGKVPLPSIGLNLSEVMASAKAIAKGAPTRDQLRTTTRQMYETLSKQGIKYDAIEYQGLGQRIDKALRRSDHFPSDAPDAFKKAAELTQEAMTQGSPSFMQLEGRSKIIGGLVREARKRGDYTLADALDIVRREIDDFALTAPFMNSGAPISTKTLTEYRRNMRGLALKNIKSRRMEEILEDAEMHPDGVIAGLRQEITTALKSKADKALFNDNERAMLKAVRDGSKPVNLLSKMGISKKLLLPYGIAGAGGAGAIMLANPIVGGSIAAGVIGSAVVGATGKAMKPDIARSRFAGVSKAMRNVDEEAKTGPNFDSQVKAHRIEANRRRMRQLLMGGPALNELKEEKQ